VGTKVLNIMYMPGFKGLNRNPDNSFSGNIKEVPSVVQSAMFSPYSKNRKLFVPVLN
jgi:hypothetical protein